MDLKFSKAKLLCETSFKNEALRLKSEAFLRDFLQKEALKLKKQTMLCETKMNL